MKKLFFFLLFITSIAGYSQISLDFQKSIPYLYQFKLNNSETKYIDFDLYKIDSTNQFSLFNLDGSLYKTIQLPPKPDSSRVELIDWVTESLFDNDSSTIEYLVFYSKDSAYGANYRAKVAREDGTILLDEPNATYNYLYLGQWGFWSTRIFNTEDGTKLILYYSYARQNGYPSQVKVFNLPGKIPNGIPDIQRVINNNLSIYPNPNNGSFYINLHSDEGNSHIIDLYSINGKLIETYKSTGTLTHINNFGLSEGVYLINTRSKSKNSTTKMVIKK
jgi:hypothetical protein